VPDGEYYIAAQLYDYAGKGTVARGLARVKVKGSDVTGLEITLLPSGSISGTVSIYNSRETIKCDARQRITLDETIINVRRDEKEDRKNETPQVFRDRPQAALTDKGEFTIDRVEPGRYRVEYNFIGEDWYVRSVRLPSTVPAKPPIDAARYGITVKQGENIKGLNITLAEGAAAVKGKIVSAVSLPEGLRVHLVPADKASVDDTLRFAETTAQSDGAFSISNIAPGRYWIIALPVTDDNRSAKLQDSTDRAALRHAAQTANVVLDLQACQRVVDYQLKYTPSAPATKKTE
jgi:hypothetical protein